MSSVVGGLPVALAPVDGESAPQAVAVRVASPEESIAEDLGGVIVEVEDASDEPAGPSSLHLRLSYEDISGLSGADWGPRLTLFEKTGCEPGAPTGDAGTSDGLDAGCTWLPLESAINDVDGRTLTAKIDLASASSTTAGSSASAVTLAVAPAASGANGDWGATSLSSSASWNASGSSGAFTWTYPMRVPGVAGGLEPQLSLSYSSAVSDGRVASTNNQASWVGEGFDLTSSYIERKYVPCAEDMGKVDGSAASNRVKTGDLCWGKDNASLVLNGVASELVPTGDDENGTHAAWRLKHDDGTRVELVTTSVSDTVREEYWRVTTLDGTRYTFGEHDAASNATWTVPVFANHPGEPDYEATFKSARRLTAWRWNLESAQDTSGNTMSYWYVAEKAAYHSLGAQNVLGYTSGGHLQEITYGTRSTSARDGAPAKVVFTTKDRCIEQSCSQTQMRAKPHLWPDLPADQYCAPGSTKATCKTQFSPVFFDRTKLVQVKTVTLDGGGYVPVDSWALAQVLRAPDGTTAKQQSSGSILQLNSLTHTGMGGTAGSSDDIALDPVLFEWELKDNRVDSPADGPSAMRRPRLTVVRSESGAKTHIEYAGADEACAPGKLSTIDPASNTARCFPVNWDPDGQTKSKPDWFHKYVVRSISEDPTSGKNVDGTAVTTGSDSVVSTYTFENPRWEKPKDALTKPSQITYSDFKGFAVVTARTGEGSEQATSVTRYLQGSGASVTVDIGDTEPVKITDRDRFEGIAYVQDQRNGEKVVTRTVTQPTSVVTTATSSVDSSVTAQVIGQVTNHEVTYAASGARDALTRATTTYNDRGLPVMVDDAGDVASSEDQLCTRYTYVDASEARARNLYGLVERTEVAHVGCDRKPQGPAEVVSDSLTEYDSAGRPVAAWRLDPDITDEATRAPDDPAKPGYQLVGRTEYDAFGRVVQVRDALGRSTTTAYSPMGASLVESVSVTTPQTASGDRLTTTTTYVPQTGWPVRSTDANKLVTTAEYDALGRLASVRYPQHAGSGPASIQYEYEVNARGQNAVVTRTLGADGKTQHVKAALYDGLLRVFQTQDENPAVTTKGQTAEQRGTVLSHTYYDSAGRVKKVAGPWVVSKTVPSAVPQDTPSSSRRVTTYRYDRAGRVTDEIVWHNTTSNSNNEKFRTVTLYDGRYTTVVPPQGGTASTTIVDGRGRTVAARQYTTRPTVQITLNDSTVSLDPRTASSAGYVEARYTYTRAGQLKSVVQDSTTSESPTWTYTYDKAGRKVSSQDPDNGTTRTVYDAVDQVVQVTDARGYSTSTTYDQLGRKTAVVGKTSAGATLSTATFVYDTAPLVGKERLALGQLASSSRTIGSDVYTTAVDGYDVAGRPTSTTVTLPAVGALGELENRSFTTAYTYMADGQVESLALPAVTTEGASGGEGVLGAETVRTYYDQASKPRWMAGGFGWGTYVADSRYDFTGQPNALDLGTTYGAAVAYSYDDLTRRLTGVALMREQIGGTDLDVTYTYDDAGNLTSAVDEPGNTALGVHRCDVQNFRYDGLRRLTQAWTANDTGECAKNATNAISSSPAPYDVAYTYDVMGNRTTATATGVNGAVTTTRYTYSSTRPHQLLAASTTGAASATATFAYDAAGHQITRTTNGSEVGLTWDAEGELTSVGTDTSAVYDANGDRLIRVDGTGTTVYLPGGQELSINAGKVTATRYYTFAGQTVAVRTGRGLGAVTSLVADMHGTTLAAVSNGSWKTTSVIKQYTDPFGATRGTAAAVPGDRQFLDKTRDQTGLTLIGARYYDEHTGRFISLDPLLDLSDPQQWNGYAYANNNPTTWDDPSGLWIPVRPDYENAGRTGNMQTGHRAPSVRPASPAVSQGAQQTISVTQTVMDIFMAATRELYEKAHVAETTAAAYRRSPPQGRKEMRAARVAEEFSSKFDKGKGLTALGRVGEVVDFTKATTVFGVAGVATSGVISYSNSKSNGESDKVAVARGVGSAAASATGALTGATAGAALGSFIPVLGTGIGALVGGAIGFFAGAVYSRTTDDAIDMTIGREHE
ncbi:RHS repeat domain-containing protein [Cellulomonas sp. CW35]|uniref:RHS repeat domain-containing protein n=1 Tax=Cellulomonas sp. CW35 TaxID=3458249 RepID=UPI00403472F0